MILTKEQQQSMLQAAKPLIKWMNDNCNPHCTVRVDQTDVELTEGVARITTDEFIKHYKGLNYFKIFIDK